MSADTKAISIMITIEGPVGPRESVDIIHDHARRAAQTLSASCGFLRVDRLSHDVMVGRYEDEEHTQSVDAQGSNGGSTTEGP